MGTHATYGFKKNGELKMSYSQYDGYPDGVGVNISRFAQSCSVEELNEIFDRIEMVSNNKRRPRENEALACRPFWNLGVSEKSIQDWYCVLREAQGTLFPYKNELKYMYESNSLNETFSYLINLDDNTFEVYNCGKLIDSYPLDNIPSGWQHQLLY